MSQTRRCGHEAGRRRRGRGGPAPLRRGPAATAAMDSMTFLEPVRVGDLVHAHAQVNWAGRSSMEVGVRVVAEPWDTAGVPPVPARPCPSRRAAPGRCAGPPAPGRSRRRRPRP
ncbi:hotdog domain-containing protein [Actinokineospora sp. G85]|uniref:hotdog domain-containing protein n=1 Tax=Actinokineospora sp. G85 TaxID=3406626 RepID=UPI003C765CBD